MTLPELLESLGHLSKPGAGFKPHKHLLLLSVLSLVEKGHIRDNRIFFSDELREEFRQLLHQFGGEADRDRPHNPFFHLSGAPFWHLVPNDGMASVLATTGSIGSSGDLVRLVSYAEVEESVFRLFQNPDSRREIENTIHRLIEEGAESRTIEAVHEAPASYSLFAHESDAIEAIRAKVSTSRLGIVLSNLELHDPQSNRYFETDLVVIASYAIYIVELKHWSGRIEVRPNSWVQNGSFYKRDPHIANNFKAKLLRGIYEHAFPQFPRVYFESVITCTNPDAVVEGAAIAATTANNPTFASIDRFVEYLRHQRSHKPQVLKDSQCAAFAERLGKLQCTTRPRDFVFPGYEIVERLYQSPERAEVVARRTDVRHCRLSRLRVFFTQGPAGESRLLHERATATLNAVAKVGDRPNILKVWSVPNENNFVVEGSDWSETGTLRDLLQDEEHLSLQRCLSIASGVLAGLSALHDECVIHRALSPENILMVGDVPKLMNFDLSYQLEDNRTTVIPDAAKLQRSPYIAPEIYKGVLTPEPTADLFSLGVMLYEMLVGERPFGCSTDLESMGGCLLASHKAKLDRANVPSGIQAVILSLIRINPADRPADAASVQSRLQALASTPAPHVVNARLKAGDRIGMYEIESFVRDGSQSQIYKAVGVQGKPIAVKLFNADAPLQRIVEEQRNAGTVHHPCLVRVDNYNQVQDGRFYIAYDWVAGGSLRNDIDGGKRPDVPRFRRVASQLLDALAVLHRFQDADGPKPIIHNDVKPDNILLTDVNRPVLIDFGSASEPHIGTYEGTEGYVAPDLRRGEDRQYCPEGDLYGLGVSLREWLGVGTVLPGAVAADIPESLLRWLSKATANTAAERFSSADEMLRALELALTTPQVEKPEAPQKPQEEPSAGKPAPAPAVVERLATAVASALCPNPFAGYLNSLHCRSAANENALAESQARNPHFGAVHVPHPLSDLILKTLCEASPQHVILTGHAGDGKSTVVVEAMKRLGGVPLCEPLSADLQPRTDTKGPGGASISMVKDLSEWSRQQRKSIIAEVVASKRRFLLVSNTGTLLDSFKAQEQESRGNPIVLENELLTAISSPVPRAWSYQGCRFTIINLSLMDNLSVAERIFRRMLSKDCWLACEQSECRNHCPIFKNIQLIRDNEAVVVSRVFLAYRRIYEYGTRLTLRQLCGHMAYMLTAGLTYADVTKMGQKPAQPLVSEFMFYNRFFGDNGRSFDAAAEQITAVRAVRKQGFGDRTAPSWERRLWAERATQPLQLNGKGCEDEFSAMRHCGAGHLSAEAYSGPAGTAHARNQVRRMLYFFHDMDVECDSSFLRAFLNSSMILRFAGWHARDAALSLSETSELKRRILHVLQEQFTGVRLPEGAGGDRHLLVTLTRRSKDVRQSAQVVLASVPEEELELDLAQRDDGMGGLRRELELKGARHLKAALVLPLPFLDYVMMRNQGAIGESIQRSYVDRLEGFKAQLLAQTKASARDDIMLVRLRTNHTFRRQVFAVRKNRLEVTDG